jgi:uncharacterized protein (TIGR00255 family)
MTGFGTGEAPLGSGKLAVEIRGTNHRFLDLRVRLPEPLAELTGSAESLLREHLSRGRFDVTAHLEGPALGAPVLDKERARVAFNALKELRDEIAPDQEVPLALLGQIPGVFAPPLARERAVAKIALAHALLAAVDAMDAMRTREGGALAKDFAARVAQVRARAAEVKARAPDLVECHKKKLLERIERLRLADDAGEAATRVAQEVALFAERIDVVEELTRLASHLDQVEGLLTSSEPIGRRLDFLLQEMARETNTISAKSPDAQTAHAVVDMKADIERMREQVQNIE